MKIKSYLSFIILFFAFISCIDVVHADVTADASPKEGASSTSSEGNAFPPGYVKEFTETYEETTQEIANNANEAANGVMDMFKEMRAALGLSDSFDGLYPGFEYKDSMAWDDCFDWRFKITPSFCPGIIPIPTPKLHFKYWEPVAMVEIVPDPWRSFLYKNSLFNFQSKVSYGMAAPVVAVTGIKPGIGTGYRGMKGDKNYDGKQNSGEQRENMHVWSIGDFTRFYSSGNAWDECRSFTCKLEDRFHCVKLAVGVIKIAKDMMTAIDSINKNQMVPGKGQGVVQGDKVSYDDGSVYQKNPQTGKFEEIRAPGNYGAGGSFSMADTLGNAADMAGMSELGSMAKTVGESVGEVQDQVSGAVDSVTSPIADSLGGTIGDVGKSLGFDVSGEDIASSINDGIKKGISKGASLGLQSAGVNTGLATGGELAVSYLITDDGKTGASSALPPETMKGGSKNAEPGNAPKGASVSETSAHNAGYTNAGNSAAANKFSEAFSGAGDMLNGAVFEQAMMVADQVTFFSPVEMVIRFIATKLPFGLYPIFMSERYEKASGDGGPILGPLYKQFGDMGAGLLAPVFCAAQSVGMGVGGIMEWAGVDIAPEMFGNIAKFLSSVCSGSWGPRDPRVNMIGNGDYMVAAGLASTRGLSIANNLSLFGLTQPIKARPLSQMQFNLDWPHQTSCHGFTGADVFSRGWTTPLGGVVDNATNAIKSGDPSKILGSMKEATVDQIAKQGGQVFTYWKERKCEVLWVCDKWSGDTGL